MDGQYRPNAQRPPFPMSNGPHPPPSGGPGGTRPPDQPPPNQPGQFPPQQPPPMGGGAPLFNGPPRPMGGGANFPPQGPPPSQQPPSMGGAPIAQPLQPPGAAPGRPGAVHPGAPMSDLTQQTAMMNLQGQGPPPIQTGPRGPMPVAQQNQFQSPMQRPQLGQMRPQLGVPPPGGPPRPGAPVPGASGPGIPGPGMPGPRMPGPGMQAPGTSGPAMRPPPQSQSLPSSQHGPRPPIPGQGGPPMPGQGGPPMPGQGGPPMPGQAGPPMPGQGGPPIPGQGGPPIPGQGGPPMGAHFGPPPPSHAPGGLGGPPGRPPMQGFEPPRPGMMSQQQGPMMGAPPGAPPMHQPGGPMVGQPGPPQAQGMPPPPGVSQPMQQSRGMDPALMPRPPTTEPGPVHYDTMSVWQGQGGHNMPPASGSSFVAQDTGNANPRYMRMTTHLVPQSIDLLSTSGLPFAAVIQPLSVPAEGEEPLPVVDFGQRGPPRCSRCGAYMNPHVKWESNGYRWQCNHCHHWNDTQADYVCAAGGDGRRLDAGQRPELSFGSVEFSANMHPYMVRQPMTPDHLFMIEASAAAIDSGILNSVCVAMNSILDEFAGGHRANIAVATYDNMVTFYTMASDQIQMIVMGDVDSPCAPLASTVMMPVQENKDQIKNLLKQIPELVGSKRVAQTALGAAVETAVKVLQANGGKVHVLALSPPTVGCRTLKHREPTMLKAPDALDKEKLADLVPQTSAYKALAISAADHQISIDLHILGRGSMDIATLAELTSTTAGSLYRYDGFSPVLDSDLLINNLRWTVGRAQGLEAVMKVRCSTGVAVKDIIGSCYRGQEGGSDLYFPSISCDTCMIVEIKHDERLDSEGSVHIQAALCYSTTEGHRRIRVHNLCLPVTPSIFVLYKSADLYSVALTMARKQALKLIGKPLGEVRNTITQQCVTMLAGYRKNCATQTSTGQLVLPEAFKFLPLVCLGMLKTYGFRIDVNTDQRASWIFQVLQGSPAWLKAQCSPRLFALNQLVESEEAEDDLTQIIPTLPCSAEHVSQTGVFLLENGVEAYVYFGPQVDPAYVQQLLNVDSLTQYGQRPIDGQLYPLPNNFSKRVLQLLQLIRVQHCNYMQLRVVTRGDPLENRFLSLLAEDRYGSGSASYMEYLAEVHKLVISKMS